MRLLIVEDEPDVVESLTEGVAEISEKLGIAIEVRVATNAEAAAIELANPDPFFDLAVIDLRIPPTPAPSIPEVQHGLGVVEALQANSRGTKVIVFSGHGGGDVTTALTRGTWSADPFGTGQDQPMLEFVTKEHTGDCLELIERVASEVHELEQIEVSPEAGSNALDSRDRRSLQIFARLQHGRAVRYSTLPGGRSGARTIRAQVFVLSPAPISTVVAKLAALPDLTRERRAYFRHVAPRLALGTFAHLASEVTAGAGDRGALLFRFADDHTASLHTLLQTSDKKSASAVNALSKTSAAWHNTRVGDSATVGTIRRDLTSDELMAAFSDAFDDVPWKDVEGTSVNVYRCSQHADLHPLNVLVDAKDRPALIDFGRTGDSSATLDPVTLEFSYVLHEDVRDAGAQWPSADQAANWMDIDTYVKGCPHPRYVRACREWAKAVSAGDREIAAYVYAYSVRQLRWLDGTVAPDVLERALALIRSSVTFLASG